MISQITDARFQRDGFEILQEQVSVEQLQRLNAEIDQVIDSYDIEHEQQVFRTDHRDRGDRETFFQSATRVHGFLEAEAVSEQGELVAKRSDALNKLGHALHDLLPETNRFARSSLIRQAFSIGGLGQTLIDQSMVILKPPKIGGDVRWHQDASYLLTKPSKVVGVWIALEDTTRENGCLWMAPGQHHSPLRERYEVDWERREGILKVIDETPWPQEDQALPLEVKAGQIVVFHDHMPHRSFANRSIYSRRAMTFHGHDSSVHWCAENWLHRANLAPFII